MPAPTYRPLERRELEVLLLLALHGVIHEHSRAEDVQLALGEHGSFGQERRCRLAERVGEEEAEDEAAEDGEDALESGHGCSWSGVRAYHESEEPEPACTSTTANIGTNSPQGGLHTRFAAHTSHVQNTICKQLGAGLPKLVTKVEEHDPLGGLASGVPRRQGPQPAGNVPRLGDAQQEACRDERAVVGLEGLERGDQSEEKQLEREPPTRADAVQNHIGRDLEEDDPEREHLLADIELVLGDTEVFEESVGERVGDVAPVCDQTSLRRKCAVLATYLVLVC